MSVKRHQFRNILELDPAIIPPGMDYAWKRVSIYRRADSENIARMDGGSWKPVPKGRHVGIPVEVDGLVLCERPKVLTDIAREAEFQKAKFQFDNRKKANGHSISWNDLEDDFRVPRFTSLLFGGCLSWWLWKYRFICLFKMSAKKILSTAEISHAEVIFPSFLKTPAVYERYAYHKARLILDGRYFRPVYEWRMGFRYVRLPIIRIIPTRTEIKRAVDSIRRLFKRH